ncbi:MAG: hypothetical protein PHQ52_05170, partial [Candidatus Omnitrophica bacterium]|nr:hypothetical protein [Candidatus Omnitrophota bacterium]
MLLSKKVLKFFSFLLIPVFFVSSTSFSLDNDLQKRNVSTLGAPALSDADLLLDADSQLPAIEEVLAKRKLSVREYALMFMSSYIRAHKNSSGLQKNMVEAFDRSVDQNKTDRNVIEIRSILEDETLFAQTCKSIDDEDKRNLCYAEAPLRPYSSDMPILTNITDEQVHEQLDEVIKKAFAGDAIGPKKTDLYFENERVMEFLKKNELDVLADIFKDLLSSSTDPDQKGLKIALPLKGNVTEKPVITVFKSKSPFLTIEDGTRIYGHASDNGIMVIDRGNIKQTSMLIVFELLRYLAVPNNVVMDYYNQFMNDYSEIPLLSKELRGVINHEVGKALINNGKRPEDLLKNITYYRGQNKVRMPNYMNNERSIAFAEEGDPLGYLFEKAVKGDLQAYNKIVDMPQDEIVAYFEDQVQQKDLIDKLPADMFGFGKGYDVRGNAQESKDGAVDLTAENLFIIGKLLGTHFLKTGQKALLTGDIRHHTPILRYVMALGLASVGVKADYCPDFITTGALNLLSTENIDKDTVMVQVSGSHGAPHKNGFKIKLDRGNGSLDPLYAEPLEELWSQRKEIAEKFNEKKPESINVGTRQGLLEKVVEILDETLPELTKDEITVIDTRAGAAGPMVKMLFAKRGFEVIEIEGVVDPGKVSELVKQSWVLKNHKKIAVVINGTPDPDMGAGIWDPSKPEALKDTQSVVNAINTTRTGSMPLAIGGVFDCDADRISAILEDGRDVPAFEMTLPYYQRFLLHPDNQEVIKKLVLSGMTPIRIACDVRANSKLLSLIDNINKKLQDETGVTDKNFIEGIYIATGYPPQLGFMVENIKRIDDFVSAKEMLQNDSEFMEKLAQLKKTYFTAEASGHNFFHVSKAYPNRVCDCAVAGLITLMSIRETMPKLECPILNIQGKNLTDLFDNFPGAYSSREVNINIPNAIKISTAHEAGKWMKEVFGSRLKETTGKIVYVDGIPQSEQEHDYFVQPKDDGYVVVAGYKMQLEDGRTALVRWSNTSEKLTTIFEGKDWRSLVSSITEIRDYLATKNLDVTPLTAEINRIQKIIYSEEKEGSKKLAEKLHAPLDPNSSDAKAFLKGGYSKELDGATVEEAIDADVKVGAGVEAGAAIDGSFATDEQGEQGYYTHRGRNMFFKIVEAMKSFFVDRERINNKPIKVIIKCGIGGQHTPFQAIANVFNRLFNKVIVVGEYELGKDYEKGIQQLLDQTGASWDQVAVVPSSKSGSTDETMLVYGDILKALFKNIAILKNNNVNGERFADVVFNTLHEMNFVQGKEKAGKDLFIVDEQVWGTYHFIKLIHNKCIEEGVVIEEEIVQKIFATVLGNMFFETTDRPEDSRLSAFARNSGLMAILGDNAPGFGAMYDNVGGRWTADVHMMSFLAYAKSKRFIYENAERE